jgi:hypothetical protein
LLVIRAITSTKEKNIIVFFCRKEKGEESKREKRGIQLIIDIFFPLKKKRTIQDVPGF